MACDYGMKRQDELKLYFSDEIKLHYATFITKFRKNGMWFSGLGDVMMTMICGCLSPRHVVLLRNGTVPMYFNTPDHAAVPITPDTIVIVQSNTQDHYDATKTIKEGEILCGAYGNVSPSRAVPSAPYDPTQFASYCPPDPSLPPPLSHLPPRTIDQGYSTPHKIDHTRDLGQLAPPSAYCYSSPSQQNTQEDEELANCWREETPTAPDMCMDETANGTVMDQLIDLGLTAILTTPGPNSFFESVLNMLSYYYSTPEEFRRLCCLSADAFERSYDNLLFPNKNFSGMMQLVYDVNNWEPMYEPVALQILQDMNICVVIIRENLPPVTSYGVTTIFPDHGIVIAKLGQNYFSTTSPGVRW